MTQPDPMGPDYESFAALVRGLWRTGHADTDEVTLLNRWRRFKHRDIDDVLRAIRAHNDEYPDAKSPRWGGPGGIFARLYERAGSGSGRNEFEHLLEVVVRGSAAKDALRKPELWKGRIPPAQMTHTDLWLGYLGAQTECITHDPLGRAYADEDGRRAKQAQNVRAREATRWILYLDGRGATTPDWLRGNE